MRIPLTERFKVKHVLIFAAALFLVQVAEGTDSLFAVLTFAYICVFAAAYNVAGGIFYPSGAWIFFTGIGTTLIGLVFKAFLGEAADSHLQEPNTTMAVYTAGLAGMGVAAWVTRLLRPRVGLLANLTVGDKMMESARACFYLALVFTYLSIGASQNTGSASSAIAQLNHFGDAAILLATTYQIQKSGGRSSSNWIVWVTAGLMGFGGVLAFSKSAMFEGFTLWFLVTIVLGFNFSKLQLVGATGFLAFMFLYMVPYSQIGRNDVPANDSFSALIDRSENRLLDLPATRAQYEDLEQRGSSRDNPHFYDEGHGIFDRLVMLPIDGALVARTDTAGVYGLLPVEQGFLNIIPHFLWKDKPVFFAGNDYGREIGVIGDYDETTGISFSSTADAYHEAKWLGVLVVEPLMMFMMFFVCDSMSGDMRKSPWGLIYMGVFTHGAPEGILPFTIAVATWGTIAVILAAVVAGWLLPQLMRLGSLQRVRGNSGKMQVPARAARESGR